MLSTIIGKLLWTSPHYAVDTSISYPSFIVLHHLFKQLIISLTFLVVICQVSKPTEGLGDAYLQPEYDYLCCLLNLNYLGSVQDLKFGFLYLTSK